jgi:hypothetical protein
MGDLVFSKEVLTIDGYTTHVSLSFLCGNFITDAQLGSCRFLSKASIKQAFP